MGSVRAHQLKEVLADSPNLPNGWQAFDYEHSLALENSLFPPTALGSIEKRLRSGALDQELCAEATRLALLFERHRADIRADFEADMDRLYDRRMQTEKAAEFDKRLPVDGDAQ